MSTFRYPGEEWNFIEHLEKKKKKERKKISEDIEQDACLDVSLEAAPEEKNEDDVKRRTTKRADYGRS